MSEEGFCRLESASQLACKALKCSFEGLTRPAISITDIVLGSNICSYRNLQINFNDAKFSQRSAEGGAIVRLNSSSPRAILRSPNFELSSPVELRFEASLSTFGARLYVCGDEEDATDLTACELVLGPILYRQKRASNTSRSRAQAGVLEKIIVQLDADIKKFAFVAIQDKAEQFGEAEFRLTKVEVTDIEGNLIC